MMGKTHALAALLLFVPIAINSFLGKDLVVFSFFLFLGSLMPDMDTKKGEIKTRIFGNLLPLIAFVSNIFLFPLRILGWMKHREITHSFLGLALIGGIWAFVFSKVDPVAGSGLILGYLSHLFVDVSTKTGIPLFFPLKFRIKGFLRTGGWQEYVFLVLLGVMGYLFFYHNIGFEVAIVTMVTINCITYLFSKISETI